MRPLRDWPTWMLSAIVQFRYRRSMWAEAYFELVERSIEAADEYAKSTDNSWTSAAPPGMH